MKRFLLCAVFLIPFMPPRPLFAVDVAPRISDREIIERLTRMEEGQKRLEAKMDQRFEAMQRQIDQRFDAVDQRFEAIDKRFEDLKWFLGTMIGVLMVMNTAVLGYLLRRQGKIEAALEGVKEEVTLLIGRLIPSGGPKGTIPPSPS